MKEQRICQSTDKNAWIEEGRALAARASDSRWELGRWIVFGEHNFLPECPSTKKARKIYFARRRENWKALISEAAEITNLSESTLRQYARVVRNDLQVEGLSFTHHLEVQRAHIINEKGKRKFNREAAWKILNLAKENEWSASQVRDEVRRQFPPTIVSESGLEKAKRSLNDVLNSLDNFDKMDLIAFIQEHIDAAAAGDTDSDIPFF